jgi:hypothetical protein
MELPKRVVWCSVEGGCLKKGGSRAIWTHQAAACAAVLLELLHFTVLFIACALCPLNRMLPARPPSITVLPLPLLPLLLLPLLLLPLLLLPLLLLLLLQVKGEGLDEEQIAYICAESLKVGLAASLLEFSRLARCRRFAGF